jgi:predicted metal-dependent phosphoesterase TrpH
VSAAFADLHVHTTNSDGLTSPEETLVRAREQGVRALVLADHSGVSFDPELVDLSVRHGVRLLWPATEISTIVDGNKFHVLAHGRAVLEPDLAEFAFRPTLIKNRVYERVLADLRAAGHPLPPATDILAGRTEAGPPAHPGKWMLGSTLVATRLAAASPIPFEDARDLVRRLYDVRKEEFPDRYVDTVEAIRRVRSAGGLPVLAHPWWECRSGRNSAERVLAQLESFVDAGLAGLEVSSRHPDPLAEEEKRALARRLGLLELAGSDFHGNGKTEIGQFGLGRSDLRRLVDTAAARFDCDLAGPVEDAPALGEEAAASA